MSSQILIDFKFTYFIKVKQALECARLRATEILSYVYILYRKRLAFLKFSVVAEISLLFVLSLFKRDKFHSMFP